MNDTHPALAKSGLHPLEREGSTDTNINNMIQNQTGPGAAPGSSFSTTSSHLSSLVGTVHVTTGRGPPALVGASTTISGDLLFVFGGRKLSKKRTQLSQEMYILDLVQRHWSRHETSGDIPSPRYFHSMNALGDTKLLCYGGMATTTNPEAHAESFTANEAQEGDPGIGVLSDIHMYDIATSKWTEIKASNPPPGRYAHCATILPSTGFYTSSYAAAQNSTSPQDHSAGGTDGRGAAELVIVGGQDSASRYIEQINVFNLRNMRWTTTNMLGKSVGAYRSVVAPLVGWKVDEIGSGESPGSEKDDDEETTVGQALTLVYSNYNFLDVKLELEVRLADGTLVEKNITTDNSPPGLRFPSGEVIDHHLVVSGTFLTSNRQEYSLWALDLRTLDWTRIDAGPGVLSSGSWNRGLLWKKRNSFLILGDRRRQLAEDYNHRRLNFSNVCTVELEPFGLYDSPCSGVPAQVPLQIHGPSPLSAAGDLTHNVLAQNLGRTALELREAADLELLAFGGEKVPVNSRIVTHRWGPYLFYLLNERSPSQLNGSNSADLDENVLREASRMSVSTITPRQNNSEAAGLRGVSPTPNSSNADTGVASPPKTLIEQTIFQAEKKPLMRCRLLYLPHSYFTVKALVYYLYTWTLPPPESDLCTPQILCSLLQIARPYRVSGLLEATVSRLHEVLDERNMAAVFNAAAMAAGGGDAVSFLGDLDAVARRMRQTRSVLLQDSENPQGRRTIVDPNDRSDIDESEDEQNANNVNRTTSSTDLQEKRLKSGEEQMVWSGELSEVIGLQKRGLRGLMEGPRHTHPHLRNLKKSTDSNAKPKSPIATTADERGGGRNAG